MSFSTNTFVWEASLPWEGRGQEVALCMRGGGPQLHLECGLQVQKGYCRKRQLGCSRMANILISFLGASAWLLMETGGRAG